MKKNLLLTRIVKFSTVRNADKIAVIEKGKVTELGTHEELLGENKTYTRLFNLQANQ